MSGILTRYLILGAAVFGVAACRIDLHDGGGDRKEVDSGVSRVTSS